MSYENIINKRYNDLSSLSSVFINATPFPHVVLDNFLDQNFFSKLKNIIPLKKTDQKKYGKIFETEVENSKWISKNSELPIELKKIIDLLNSKDWIENLEKLSDIKDLFSTVVGNTMLANYHEMSENGFLGSHVDHSSDPNTKKPHVMNIILYLTDDWHDKWGGATLLYDKKGKKIIKEIKYVSNRAIIFLHTPYSFHGVSNIKLNNFVRSSIYVDYYSNNLKPYQNYNLKFDNKWFQHDTCFILPKYNDYLKPKNFYYTKTLLKYNLKKITHKLFSF